MFPRNVSTTRSLVPEDSNVDIHCRENSLSLIPCNVFVALKASVGEFMHKRRVTNVSYLNSNLIYVSLSTDGLWHLKEIVVTRCLPTLFASGMCTRSSLRHSVALYITRYGWSLFRITKEL
jgi:hypothetical protein